MMLLLLVLSSSLIALSCDVVIISLLDHYTLLTNKQIFLMIFLKYTCLEKLSILKKLSCVC